MVGHVLVGILSRCKRKTRSRLALDPKGTYILMSSICLYRDTTLPVGNFSVLVS
jgi:hypothetical protein